MSITKRLLEAGQGTGKTFAPPVQMRLSVTGLKQLQALFDKVPRELKMVIFKRAFSKGADIMQQAAISNLPPSKRKRNENSWKIRVYRYGRTRKAKIQSEGGGTLRKALTGKHGRLWKNNKDGYPEVFVGPSWRKYARPYNAWYAHFVEYGTKNYKGHHYMERALNSTRDAVYNAIEKQMIKDITKIFN